MSCLWSWALSTGLSPSLAGYPLNPWVDRMLPSELCNPDSLGPSQYLPLTVRAFFTTNHTPVPPPPTHQHTHTPNLCVSFFAKCLRLKGPGKLCSHLDWGTEMSCSHAVDVDRSRAHFSSMCHWTLKQNIQDVFWLPRLPADIILPSLSFLSPPPQVSSHPPLPWVVMCHSTWQTAHSL